MPIFPETSSPGMVKALEEVYSDRMELRTFLDACPTPYHAVETTVHILKEHGWISLSEGERWVLRPAQGYYVDRMGQGLVFFRVGQAPVSRMAFRIGVAHTDSPALKPRLHSWDWRANTVRVGIEVYGSPSLASWLDREFTLAGKVLYSSKGKILNRVFRLSEPCGLIPSLGLHLQRDTLGKVGSLEPHQHLSFLMPAVPSHVGGMFAYLERALQLEEGSLLDADVFLSDTQGASVVGSAEEQWIVSGRLDNLAGCHAVLEGMLRSTSREPTAVGALFMAEEVGSLHPAGAHSDLLHAALGRIVTSLGGSQEDLQRVKSRSFAVSIDAAHGLHPNYADRHDPHYAPHLGMGTVLKLHSGFRYATSPLASVEWAQICAQAGVALQRYMSRADLGPGSTVGPIVSATTGVLTADVGIPLWAMHSLRETAHLRDQESIIEALRIHYERPERVAVSEET